MESSLFYTLHMSGHHCHNAQLILVKLPPLAHGLTVLKTPRPNASRDSLRFPTICAETKVQLATPLLHKLAELIEFRKYFAGMTGFRKILASAKII